MANPQQNEDAPDPALDAIREEGGGSTTDDGPGHAAQRDLEMPTAHEIYVQVARNGRHELERSARALAVSGLAGGMMMGLTPLAMSIIHAQLGDGPSASFIAYLLYPIGFIAVIVGRAQLFTENTLYPVALVLAERKHVWKTLRLWAIVLASNLVGAFLFALLAVRTEALKPEYVSAMSRLGIEAVNVSIAHAFWPLRPCDCDERGDSGRGALPPDIVRRILWLAGAGGAWKYLRRRPDGDAAGVRTGQGRLIQLFTSDGTPVKARSTPGFLGKRLNSADLARINRRSFATIIVPRGTLPPPTLVIPTVAKRSGGTRISLNRVKDGCPILDAYLRQGWDPRISSRPNKNPQPEGWGFLERNSLQRIHLQQELRIVPRLPEPVDEQLHRFHR
jgi:hypothetical protein